MSHPGKALRLSSCSYGIQVGVYWTAHKRAIADPQSPPSLFPTSTNGVCTRAKAPTFSLRPGASQLTQRLRRRSSSFTEPPR